MKYQQKKQAVILLEDGKVFYGKAAGKIGTTSGEICFNTGMTGYQEVFTDPSYFGQVMVTTNVHIGNYGVSNKEVESDSIKIAGLVCKRFNEGYSRTAASGSLQEYFEKQNIVAISDVDTRALVRYVRDKGAMNAIISSEEIDIEKLKQMLSKVPSMDGLELASKVTTKSAYTLGDESASYRVAVIDLGAKKNILRCLAERDCYLKVFPMKTAIEEINSWEPDAYMISNGPGDPSAMPDEIALIKNIISGEKPVFGICLGHQLIALANGLNTYKMHKGHRGINHPVKNLITGKCEITSQNHGFAVSAEEALENKDIEVTHINLNDDTLEGLKMKSKQVFSVQYHPEAAPGPHDSRYLFDDFIHLIKQTKGIESNVAS